MKRLTLMMAVLMVGLPARCVAQGADDAAIREAAHGFKAALIAGDIGFLKSVPPVLTSDQVTVYGDMALYTSESTSTGEYRDREINSRGAETLVLLRTEAGWKIRHIHWSSGRG